MDKKKLVFWTEDFDDKWIHGYSIKECITQLEMNDLTDSEIDEVFRNWVRNYTVENEWGV